MFTRGGAHTVARPDQENAPAADRDMFAEVGDIEETVGAARKPLGLKNVMVTNNRKAVDEVGDLEKTWRVEGGSGIRPRSLNEGLRAWIVFQKKWLFQAKQR